MKRVLAFVILCFAVCTASANLMVKDNERQALYEALAKAAPVLKNAPFGKAAIAILPTRPEYALLSGRLKSMLVNAGFVCLEGKDDPMMEEILKEIEWGERKSDILDNDTIVKFGRLKAANILMQCTVRVLDSNAERIYAELELKATEIATGKVIWAEPFSTTYYTVSGVMGIVKLNKEQYEAIEKGFERARKSLLSSESAAKLSRIKTVSVIPLSGAESSYMTGLATRMLTKTDYVAKSPRIANMSLLRTAARNDVFDSDAVMYGSVRSLYATKPVNERKEKQIVTSYDMVADIHLFIEDVKTGSVLWAEVVRINDTISSSRDMTAAELKQYRQEKVDSISGEITEDVIDNWKKYLKMIGIAVGAILVLIILFIGIKSIISYNDVR